MNRPRAVDDFAGIRNRIEELQRERGRAPAKPEAQPLPPREDHAAPGGFGHAGRHYLLRTIRQKFLQQTRFAGCAGPPLDGRGG